MSSIGDDVECHGGHNSKQPRPNSSGSASSTTKPIVKHPKVSESPRKGGDNVAGVTEEFAASSPFQGGTTNPITGKERVSSFNISSNNPPDPVNPSIDQQSQLILSLLFSESKTELFDKSKEVSKNLLSVVTNFVIPTLTYHNKFRPPNDELEQTDFKGDRSDMSQTNLAGNYYTGDAGHEKNGRATLLRTTKERRYKDTNHTRSISIYDRYDSDLLDKYERFIKNELITALNIQDDDNLGTYQGQVNYQKRTGISPFFATLLLNIRQYGFTKRGVFKAIVLNLEEIAFYEAFKMKRHPVLNVVNPMEMLHDKYLGKCKSGMDAIDSQGQFMKELLQKLMFGNDPQSYTWKANEHVASWAPSIGGLNRVTLGGEEKVSEKEGEVWDSIKSIITANISDPKQMLTEISDMIDINLQIDIIAEDVAEITRQVQEELGRNRTELNHSEPATTVVGNQILIVTEYIYYRLSGRSDSFFDPLGTVTDGWDPSSVEESQMGASKVRMSNAIDHLKGGRDSKEDACRIVRYLFFDTNSVAFGDLKGAESMIRGKGYKPLGQITNEDGLVLTNEDGWVLGFEFCQMKPFWHW